jgi:uncharacterized protein (UPF0332 family)
MQRLNYKARERKRASTLLALGESEAAASRVLLSERLYREAVVHLYFSCFYLSQALLQQHLKEKPSHKNVEATLHRIYGRSKNLPRIFVALHSRLHNLRNKNDYERVHSPAPTALEREQNRVERYIKATRARIETVGLSDILATIMEDNPHMVRDFSFDIYCPKTYRHHTRLTIWLPPYPVSLRATHLRLLIRKIIRAMRQVRIRRATDYVAGINSKVDQYKDVHLLQIDIDSFDSSVEERLSRIGGTLLRTERGFHFLGRRLIGGRRQWESALRRLLRDRVLKGKLDSDHLILSLRRGYSTLRITASGIKPSVPSFYKEL